MTTIKQIAEIAGVSIGTVDRVIHNRGRVAPETEARVRRIVSDLGYKPNFFARTLKLSRTYTLGILMPEENQDGGYWSHPAVGIKKALDELRTIQIQGRIFYYNKYSVDSLRQVEKSIEMNALDGFLIAPVLIQPITRFIEKLPKQMPYVFFDSNLPELHPISVINQDAYKSGRLAADLMIKITQTPGTFLIVKNIPDDYHISARCQGFMEYIHSADGYDVQMHEVNVGSDSQNLYQLIKTFRNQNSDLKGIFITNALTYQMAETIVQFSFKQKPALIGYDLIESNALWLKRGIIDFIISQRPEMQGYQGIYSLYRHIILKEPVLKKIRIPLDVITKENMDNRWI